MTTPTEMRKSLSKAISYTASAIIGFGLLFALIAIIYLPYYYEEFSDVETVWSFLGFNIPISEHHFLGSPQIIFLIIVAISIDVAVVASCILNFFGNMKIKSYETTYAIHRILSEQYGTNTGDPES